MKRNEKGYEEQIQTLNQVQFEKEYDGIASGERICAHHRTPVSTE